MRRYRGRTGITLSELVVAIGIIGLVGFLTPILVRLFNYMGYLQQKSLLQAEARGVMWQMSHEVSNAVRVDVPGGLSNEFGKPGCTVFNAAVINAPENYNCMKVWIYDYEQYSDNGNFENPEMFMRCVDRNGSPPVRETPNFVQIIYEVIKSPDGKDYLSKRTVYPVWGARVDPSTKTYFKGRISADTAIRTFTGLGAEFVGQTVKGTDLLFKVTLKLKTSFDRASTPFRYFSAMVTMTGQREETNPNICP